jgi:hypothetical protein
VSDEIPASDQPALQIALETPRSIMRRVAEVQIELGELNRLIALMETKIRVQLSYFLKEDVQRNSWIIAYYG